MKMESLEKESTQDKTDTTRAIVPNSENGGKTSLYEWTQTLKEASLSIPLPEGTRPRDLNIVMKSNFFSVQYKHSSNSHNHFILKGELSKDGIQVDDSFWEIEDRNTLLVTFVKKREDFWSNILVGEPELDTSAMVPESRRIQDLDPETRTAVEKMMFEQRQKQQGLPSCE